MKKTVIVIVLFMSLISCGGSNETSTGVSTYDSVGVDSSVTATDSTVSQIISDKLSTFNAK
jgi:uncharacterized lipoprotein YehR (DUF1307 family)